MMSQKKIIIVTPWFGEFAGGAEVLSKNIAIELNKRGVETIVFTTCCKAPYSDWWKDDYKEGEYEVYGLKTIRFSVNKTKEQYEKAITTWINKKKLTEKQKIDFFISGINSDRLVTELGIYIEKGYEAIAMPFYQGLTHSVVNAYPNKVSITPCFHDEEPFYWSPVEILLSNAKYIYYNSHEEKELTIKNYGERIGRKLVESPVPGVGVELESSPESSNIELPETDYFVYMGRKDKGKNFHLLVEWFSSYIENNQSNKKLVIIGGGDASLVPESDHFVDFGFVSENDKLEILLKSKGLINLSENESFSIVIMEAWLNSIPVIVHNKCKVTTGHSIRANAGLFPENSNEFSACLNYLVENNNISEQMGINGKRYVENNYTHDTVLEKYLSVMV